MNVSGHQRRNKGDESNVFYLFMYLLLFIIIILKHYLEE